MPKDSVERLRTAATEAAVRLAQLEERREAALESGGPGPQPADVERARRDLAGAQAALDLIERGAVR